MKDILQLLFENARDYAIFTLDPNGTIATWNPGAELILGYSEKEAVGQPAQIIFTPEDRSAGIPETEFLSALSTGQSVDERWHLRKGGARFWASGMLIRLQNEKGQIQGYAKILRDQTEKKILNNRLEEAVQARDEFIAMASHELKTPLTTLSLGLERLLICLEGKKEFSLPADQVIRLVHSSVRQVQRMNQLVNLLLNFAEMEKGMVLSTEPLDLGKWVVKSLEDQRLAMESNGCELILKVDQEIHAQVDPLRLEQVLMNLLTNASKFGAGKPILVTVSRREKIAIITVEDQGIGISPEEKALVFERFYRVPKSAAFSGLGLGLFISKQIMELHGGRILVESEVGAGAKFILELPLP